MGGSDSPEVRGLHVPAACGLRAVDRGPWSAMHLSGGYFEMLCVVGCRALLARPCRGLDGWVAAMAAMAIMAASI